MPNDPLPFGEAQKMQSVNPAGEDNHCCECYQKSLDYDYIAYNNFLRDQRCMRAMEVLEIDTGRCSTDLRDTAEKVVKSFLTPDALKGLKF